MFSLLIFRVRRGEGRENRVRGIREGEGKREERLEREEGTLPFLNKNHISLRRFLDFFLFSS